ncbi:MAG: DUF5906 domain-containing protein, partial [Bacillota bacterium]
AHAIEGKLANICADVYPVKIEYSELIKKITTGDSIDAEIKNGPTYNYEPVTKLLFSANKLPEFHDTTDGFYRRLEIVKFPNKFSPGMEGYDPQLTSKLKEELPGIARWAIKGLIRLLKQDKQFTISESMKNEKLKYMDNNYVFKKFKEEFVIVTENKDDYIATERLYQKYKEWAGRKGLTPESKNMLTRYFNDNEIGLNKKDADEKGATIKTINGKSTRCYIGLKLKNGEEKEVINDSSKEENDIGNFEFDFMK